MRITYTGQPAFVTLGILYRLPEVPREKDHTIERAVSGTLGSMEQNSWPWWVSKSHPEETL